MKCQLRLPDCQNGRHSDLGLGLRASYPRRLATALAPMSARLAAQRVVSGLVSCLLNSESNLSMV
jgi:hypothetical protein